MPANESPRPNVPVLVQGIAWLAGLGICLSGLFDGVKGWSFPYAVAALVWLAVVPVGWGWRRRWRTAAAVPETSAHWRQHLIAVVVLMSCSLGMSVWTAVRIGAELPPIYHDEYSYLFQAKTFLWGRTWLPSHPTHPELFDQMHVLNDGGRMASRYFPGTGAWMAPFVAFGAPYWGHWLCGMLATAFVYATGCELGHRRAGWFAGLLFAFSPGVALFGNLLLAHHPTLLGLSFFLWRISRLQRTFSGWDAAFAGVALSWAMLCRPMTAAGFGLPFGIGTAWWLLRGAGDGYQKRSVLVGLAVPIVLGLAIQFGYNASITGSPWSSPYQLYTDIYTPRHVYGFNNVARGERQLGPKVLDKYDRWAENLDARLAVLKVKERFVHSLIWTWDLLPLTMLGIVLLGVVGRWELRRQLAVWAMVTLHIVHIPYWFSGIMGWHYVFETVILWCVVSGLVLDQLLVSWRMPARPFMAGWLTAFLCLTMVGNWCDLPGEWTSKITQEVPMFRSPRRTIQEFQDWTQRETQSQPSLVLVAPHQREPYLDYVVNDPGLQATLLYGRFVPGKTDLQQIARDFPDRAVWLCEPDGPRLTRVSPGR